MTHHDESDSGWDFLAEDLGITSDKPSPVPEKKESPPERPAHRPVARPTLIQEEDSGDFGEGLIEPSAEAPGALFDPGPDAVAEDDDDFESADTEDDGDDSGVPGSGDQEGSGDGKKKRRRRRRKKKGGPVTPEIAEAAEHEAVVEEGEAPGEIESDDDESESHSAMDEEMEAEAVGPRHEWHVMTWADLVSKLYRPN
jgi:hypothetical protein